ncbi:hypothetical protein G6646_02060 [Polynucleobacter paneuropaeus]|nr:hypothetical protein [Polynucleobacter paneuropaeus]
MSYPELTQDNHRELEKLIDQLKKSVINSDWGTLLDCGWPIISPKGSSTSVCSRNILSIGGDKSNFYKQRWKNVHALEEASVYLLDYYERCKHITKLGVLLTDVWRPSTLSRWGHIYEMYETIGIQSVALLYSGHQITLIRWPWR